MPSPVPERPGLLLRDPFQYTDATIIVPPGLARMLGLFDGRRTELDLRAAITQLTGEIESGELASHFLETLDANGFLESPVFEEMRDKRQKEFAEAAERLPAHAGTSYPDDAEALRQTLARYDESAGEEASADNVGELLGIAAPHVSPEGGYRSYAAAYSRIRPEHAGKTFVILGTSHYGESESFGLTRKPYQTPLGAVETDVAFVDELARKAGGSVKMEDFCHASEHSIEFQSVFLQGRLGPHLPDGERLRAVPILCGPLAESLYSGKAPEANDRARRFFEALGEVAEQRDDLIWVLGVDMAHIGRRYGDSFEALAGKGRMLEVRRRDEERFERLCAADSAGFFDLVHRNRDDLRWCGYGPMYTFLQSAPKSEGRLLSYEQWNIDDQSVVSFVGAAFRKSN